MLKILQRYTLKEVLGPFLLALLVFTFVLFSARLYRLLDLLLNWGADPLRMLKLLGCLLPSLLSLTIPMALLAGVMIGCGRLAAEREIMAIRASGINLLHLIVPLQVLAALLSLALIVLNFNLMPNLVWKLEELKYAIEFDLLSHPKPRVIFDDIGSGGEDTVKFVYRRRDTVRPEMLHGIAIEIISSDADAATTASSRKIFLSAPTGTINSDPDSGLIRLTLFKGQALVLNLERPETVQLLNFERLIRDFYPRLRGGKDPEHLSLSQLRAALAASAHWRPKDRGALKVELCNRLSIPLACLAFAWFGVPLALIVRPRGKAHSYSFTIGLVFCYYVIMHFGKSLGENDSPFAGLVIFLPNLILFALGTALLRKIIRL